MARFSCFLLLLFFLLLWGFFVCLFLISSRDVYLLDTSFNTIFSDPHCGYLGRINADSFNPPATDSGRTARTPMYPPVQAVPPSLSPSPFFSCPGQRNWRRPVSLPVTGVRCNSLCTLNTLI